MSPLFAIPLMILNVVWFIIIAHFIMSWLLVFNVLNPHQPIVNQIWTGLNRLLSPIYDPIRRYMPDMGGIDLAPLIALLAVYALRYTVTYYGIMFS